MIEMILIILFMAACVRYGIFLVARYRCRTRMSDERLANFFHQTVSDVKN